MSRVNRGMNHRTRRTRVTATTVDTTGEVVRVEWTEYRRQEAFRVIADRKKRGWRCDDQGVWETGRWYPMKTTPAVAAFLRRQVARIEKQNHHDRSYVAAAVA
jgi:hypothetical protein